jgi:hypothetical protein
MRLMIVFAIAIMIGLVRSAGVLEKSKLRNGTLVFPPSTPLRIALFCGGVLFLWLGIGFAARVGAPYGAMFFLFAGFELAAWPSTIEVNESAIVERRPFLPAKTIGKNSIISAVYDNKSGETAVMSTDGPVITHQNHHSDSLAFREAIRKWKKLEEV